jgi:DNA invertase Pin-like site-specific DNA recombinase
MGRVLGRIRLSRFTVESTSVERQREIIEQWSKLHDHEVVAWATDVDLSRSVDPFDAPELGPYFEPEARDGWDIVACWKLDRLATGSIYLNKLMSWCFEHDKSLASVTESLDLSTWVGRMIANNIASVAEGELEAIRERTDASRAKLVQLGRWHGGTTPFGYQAVKNPAGEGWVLNTDQVEGPVVTEVYARAAKGESPGSLARWLNTTDHKPRRGGQWTDTATRRMLRARWPLGQQLHKGRLAIGPDGLPVQRAPELVPVDLWETAQAALDDRERPRKASHGVQLLLNVAECRECGSPLYFNAARGRRYWRCRSTIKREGCRAPSVPAGDLEAWVTEQFLEQIGDLERTERVFVPAAGDSEVRARLDRAIANIRQERDAGLYDQDDAGYMSRLSALVEQRRKHGDASDDTEAHWEHRPIGETYRQAWDRMDTHQRRDLLVGAGITVPAGTRPFRAEFRVPHDIMERLQRA